VASVRATEFVTDNYELPIVPFALGVLDELSVTVNPLPLTDLLQRLQVQSNLQNLGREILLKVLSLLQRDHYIGQQNAGAYAFRYLIGGNPRFYVIFAEFLSRESLEDLWQPFIKLLDELTPYYQSRMVYLSRQQREIIEFLGDRKYPATVKDIAQRSFTTSQTTSSQLKELKEKGYVNVESIGRESFYTLKEPLMRICLGMKKERDSKALTVMVDFLRAWYSKEDIDSLAQSGKIELVLEGLLTQDSSQWQTRINDLISWFEPFPTSVTNGLVSVCRKLISPLISNTTATLWHDTWHQLTHDRPEYQLPLRLLTTALHYKQKPDDPRVWMELSIEERKILQQALDLDSVGSRD
jgi:DNA-binding transcriptional ArsR family regulator